MKSKIMALIAMFALIVAAVTIGASTASAAEEVPGTSPENPIVVTDPSEVPEGAVEDEASTYDTPEACDTTRSWVLTIPATEDVTHHESRYMRTIPEVGQVSHPEYQIKRYVEPVAEESHLTYGMEKRTRDLIPAQEEVSHKVYSYKKSVQDFKTENKFMYRKYVTGYFENRQGQNKGSFPYEIYNSSNGWSGELHHEGAWGQETATDGSGGHNDTTGYNYSGNRKHSTAYEYRKSELIDTRQVPNGSHFEYSGEQTTTLGSPWVLLSGYPKTVVDEEAVPASWTDWGLWQVEIVGATTEPEIPLDNDYAQYRATEPVKVVDTEAKDGYWVYYTNPGESTNPADAAWILASEGLGAPWVNHAERTIVDVEHADAYEEYYVLGGEPSRNEADASWLLDEQVPAEGWTMFDERTVTDENGTPEVVTYYAYTDGAECDKPEGFENSDTTEECVKGDLVTTTSTETGTPVQAEDGSWTVEVTAASSQSVKEDAAKCAPKDNPPPPNNPPSNPNVPTSIDAGLSGPTADSNTHLFAGGLGLLLVLASGGLMVAARRSGTEQ